MEMLVKVKVATGMRKILSIGLVLFLVAGCGTSAQQKRNNFDACIIEKGNEYWAQAIDDGSWSQPTIKEQIASASENFCVKFLQ